MSYRKDLRLVSYNSPSTATFNKKSSPYILIKESLDEMKLITLPSSDLDKSVVSSLRNDNVLTVVTALLKYIKEQLELKDSDCLVIPVPLSWNNSQRSVLLNACKLAQISEVYFVPDCVSMALNYGHYLCMNNEFANKTYNAMFIDIGATHMSVSIVEYNKKSIIVRAQKTTKEITSNKIEEYVKEEICKCAEEDKEEIEEEYEEKLEDVISDLNFVNNRKKVKEVRELCSSGKQDSVSINWDGGNEYENTYEIKTEEIFKKMESFEPVITEIIKSAIEEFVRSDAAVKEINRCEIIGGNCHWVNFKKFILDALNQSGIPVISFICSTKSLNHTPLR